MAPPFIINEPFDDPLLADTYIDASAVLSGGQLLMSFAGGSSSIMYSGYWVGFAGGLEQEIKFKMDQPTVDFTQFALQWNSLQAGYLVQLQATGSPGSSTLQLDYTIQVAYQSSGANPVAVLLNYDEWNWLKIVQEDADSTGFYYRKDSDAEYTLLAKFTSTDGSPYRPSGAGEAPVQMRPRFITTSTGSYPAYSMAVDHYRITDISDPTNPVAGMKLPFSGSDLDEVIYQGPHMHMLSGYPEFIYLPLIQNNPINESDFFVPLPPYAKPGETGASQGHYEMYDGPSLSTAVTILGDFIIRLNARLSASVVEGDFSGFKIEINGVEILVGIYREVSEIEYISCLVDGVLEYQRFDGSAGDNIYQIALKGTHLTVYVSKYTRDGTVSATELAFEDLNFLAGAGQYTTKNIGMYRSWIEDFWNFELLSLELYFNERGPLDVSGSISGSTEDHQSYLHAGLQPPPVADPSMFMHRTGLTGGTADDVDGIDPQGVDGTVIALQEGSTVWVITPDMDMYLYRAWIDASATHDPPEAIIPATNPGDWVWKRVRARQFEPAFFQNIAAANLYSTSHPNLLGTKVPEKVFVQAYETANSHLLAAAPPNPVFYEDGSWDTPTQGTLYITNLLYVPKVITKTVSGGS